MAVQAAHPIAMVELMKHNEADVRVAAASALDSLSIVPSRVAGPLAALLQGALDSTVRACAVNALGRMDEIPQEIASLLTAALESTDSQLLQAAAQAFGRLSPAAQGEHAEAVLRLFGHANRNVRRFSGVALGQLSSVPRKVR